MTDLRNTPSILGSRIGSSASITVRDKLDNGFSTAPGRSERIRTNVLDRPEGTHHKPLTSATTSSSTGIGTTRPDSRTSMTDGVPLRSASLAQETHARPPSSSSSTNAGLVRPASAHALRRDIRESGRIPASSVRIERPFREVPDAQTVDKAMDGLSVSVSRPTEEENIVIDDRGKTRAEVLKEWRIQKGITPLSTSVLLRDMLYLLQGIDGTHIRFALKTQAQKNFEANPYLVEPDFTSFGVAKASVKGKGRRDMFEGEEEITGLTFADENGQPYAISSSLQTTIVDLAELGMLYRRILAFVRSKDIQGGLGAAGTTMTEQSLCHFLQAELSSYHELLTILEHQMAKESTDPLPADSTSHKHELIFGDVPTEDSGMSFQKLSLWAEDVILKMRMMSLLVEDAKTYRGGSLLSAIHSHTSHGDPFIQEFTDRILQEVSKPFFQTLQKWIFSGQLQDPFNEFFVQLNPEQRTLGRHSPMGDMGFATASGGFDGQNVDRNNIAYMLWEKQYVFDKGMLPRFVNEEFGRKIFSTGKSINFIRYSCHDSEWSSIQSQLAEVHSTLTHSDIPRLERTIDEAYSIASKRLLEIFFDKYKLLEHLQAMKRYILLCEGDFADLLLECIGPRLNREATKLLRHHLTQDIETAIQGTNARHEPADILRRLDARIFEPAPGDLGWDCFALEYKVEAPINAVLDGKAMIEYDRLFSHLWRIRRVNRALQGGWLRLTYAPRRLKGLRGFQRLFHRAQILQAQMIHFLAQIESFCSLEAIELAWEDFLVFVKARQGDLDALIGAHRAYLKTIVSRALLLHKKEMGEESLLKVLQDALGLVMTFATLSESVYHLALAEALRLDRQLDVERGILSANTYRDDPTKAAQELATVDEQVTRCTDNFRAKMAELVYGLESHPNYEVRFLAIRLSFNEHYSARKPAKSKLASKSRTNLHEGTVA